MRIDNFGVLLLDDENVLWEGKPVRGLLTYMLVQYMFALVLIFGMIIFAIIMSLRDEGIIDNGSMMLVIVVFLSFCLVFSLLFSNLEYRKRYYWVTNKRLIFKRGILGYRVSSIPVERVSDVILSRTFMEQLFGFESLMIQTMAGQITQGGVSGSEADLRGVEDAEQVQKIIIDQIKKSNKPV